MNLVEIDLLRGGPRLPLEDLPECDYYAMVARPEDHPQAAVWPLRLRDPLPTIPIPLRAPDADTCLDLQAVLHRTYDAAVIGITSMKATRNRPCPKLTQPGAAELARRG